MATATTTVAATVVKRFKVGAFNSRPLEEALATIGQPQRADCMCKVYSFVERN